MPFRNFYMVRLLLLPAIVGMVFIVVHQAYAGDGSPTTIDFSRLRPIQRQQLQKTNIVTSAVQRTSGGFNAIGFLWRQNDLPSASGTLQVRTFADSIWGRWHDVQTLGDMPDVPRPSLGRVASDLVIVRTSSALQVRLLLPAATPATEHPFQSVQALTMFSGGTPVARRVLSSLTPQARAGNLVSIIPRGTWADTNNAQNMPTDLARWPSAYAQVKKFIVHHTATDEGTDPVAAVNSVYRWHAEQIPVTGGVSGWGDIGYNYVIDAAGNIYEGRAGGDGVIGGHTFRDAYNGQPAVNYNVGSIGIALLGNFSDNLPSPAAEDSLESLIAEKGQLFGLKPSENGYFRTGDMPNIVGHRDVDYTECPGETFYETLSTTRENAEQKFNALPALPTAQFQATLTTAPASDIYLETGAVTSVSVQYVNTSSTQWQTYVPSRRVSLVPIAETGNSLLQSNAWVSSTEVGSTDAANVPQQATAVFTLSLTAPVTSVNTTQTFALRDPSGLEIPNTRFTLTVHETSVDYGATLDASSVPISTFATESKTITVRVTNVGLKTWNAGEIVLQAYDPGYLPSAFRAANWGSPNGNFTVDQDTVAPGQTGTFTVRLRSPKTVGVYQQIFSLKHKNGNPVIAPEVAINVRSDSPYRAQFMSSTLPKALRKKWSPRVTLVYKNTGITTWKKGTVLRVYASNFKTSAFAHPSWFSAKGAIPMTEKAVAPGKTATFAFRVRAPVSPGVYEQLFRVESKIATNGITNGLVSFLTRVDP